MTPKKKVLLIGIDPYLIDFNSPEFAAFPGMTAEKVNAGIKGSIQELKEAGYEADLCWTDMGHSAVVTLEKFLALKSYDGIMIGAGIRKAETNFLLFEQMINAIHQHAPKARLCFNTHPKDTMEAFQRWV